MSRKKAQWIAILVVAAFLGLQQVTHKSEAETMTQELHRPEIVGTTASLSQRLGADEPPAFVLHFTGDIHGSLEPCG